MNVTTRALHKTLPLFRWENDMMNDEADKEILWETFSFWASAYHRMDCFVLLFSGLFSKEREKEEILLYLCFVAHFFDEQNQH